MPRKLLLQMHFSLDGYIAGPDNSLFDWITSDWTQDLKDAVTQFSTRVDHILLGRNLAEGFIPAWKGKYSSDPGADFINATPKTVFSNSLEDNAWGDDARVVSGIAEDEVRRMKGLEGKDMIAYGGLGLVQKLVNADLVDEFFLLMEPVALGEGAALFMSRKNLELVDAKKMDCGTTELHYRLKQ